jgi:hypothetical protein
MDIQILNPETFPAAGDIITDPETRCEVRLTKLVTDENSSSSVDLWDASTLNGFPVTVKFIYW